jgi:2-oxoglutarate dehydrogenase complex dehydrogenase (E1) component-like enzyme
MLTYRYLSFVVFAFASSWLALGNVPEKAMQEMRQSITKGNYYALKSAIDSHVFTYEEAMNLVYHAEKIEQESQKNAILTYTGQKLARLTLIAASLAASGYGVIKCIEHGSRVDAMQRANLRWNGQTPRFIAPNQNEHYSQQEIHRVNGMSNLYLIQSVLAVGAAGVIAWEGILGYYTNRSWYILNYLTSEFGKFIRNPPFQIKASKQEPVGQAY